MFQLYRPSGKISAVFYPMLILMLGIVVPAISFLYITLVLYIPSTIVDIVVYVIVLILLCAISSKYCVKIGKVRNKRAAGIAASLIFLWFCYLSLVMFQTLYTGHLLQDALQGSSQDTLNSLLTVLLKPVELPGTLKSLMNEGYAFKTFKRGYFCTYRGPVMAVLWVIKFLVSLLNIRFYLKDDSVQPFCEASKRWARKFVFQLETVEDIDDFKKQIMFGNMEVIKNLDSLREANANHCEVTLYAAEGDNSFYVTLVNKYRNGGPDGTGNIKFDDQEIFEFLSVDHDTGNILLVRSRTQNMGASARIVNHEVKSKERMEFVKMFFFATIQIVILTMVVMDHDILVEVFSNVGILFYLLLNIVVWAVDLWGAFQKEDIVEDEGGVYAERGISSTMISRQSRPLYIKVFYLAMFAMSLFLLLYGVKEIMA